MTKRRKYGHSSAFGLAAVLTWGCSQTGGTDLPSDGPQQGSGGTTSTGSGGTDPASGGAATSSGGSANAGGTTASGGSSGGASATGGSGNPGSGGGGDVPLGECDPYTFPAYEPNLDYDFRDEFADIDPENFEVYLGCDESEVAGYETDGWFAFIWGPNRNPSITDEDIDQVLSELNEDMAFARDVMGWPPDRLAQEGYFSNVYLYGSGLCTDNASNTETGGWQSGINGYPMVLLSYYPVVNHDRGGITHEAIHAIMASMDGRKAHWFNEGGNTWLQMNMSAEQTGNYGVGFLDGVPFLAPHQPIECYSGWLQDGSFGGPDAEGVNQTSGGQQISTWRDYLGGSQYNSVFSHFLALYVSPGSNAWLWSNTNHINVLETLADGLGVEQTQRAIVEYRARQALLDFGPWTEAFEEPIDGNWGRTIGAEEIAGGILMEPPAHQLTAYAETTLDGTTLTPEPLTLPGWSGANQVPLTVSSDAGVGTEIRVNFEPLGANMRFQLAYRAEDGSAVYGQPIAEGTSCLRLDQAPRDGVVIGVVSNVNHLFEGESSRTTKYDYRLHLEAGVDGTADVLEQYF